MLMDTIEIQLPHDIVEAIDKKVGPTARSRYLSDFVSSHLKLQIEESHEELLKAAESRYNPVPNKGEPASVILLRDRGPY